MEYWLKLIGIALIALPAYSISELNEDFIDQEFALYFSNVYQSSVAQADQRLTAFAQHLKLKPEQKEIWLRFKVTFLEQLQNRIDRQKKLMQFKQNHPSLSSLDTLALRREHLETRLRETEKLSSVIKPLYQQLTDDQQSKFDATMKHLWLRNFQQHSRNSGVINVN